MGIAENGFRELTNSKHEVKTVDDMKNLKVRVAGSNLLMECYKRWGADATNMNWSETYTEPVTCHRCSQCTGGTAVLLHVGCNL